MGSPTTRSQNAGLGGDALTSYRRTPFFLFTQEQHLRCKKKQAFFSFRDWLFKGKTQSTKASCTRWKSREKWYAVEHATASRQLFKNTQLTHVQLQTFVSTCCHVFIAKRIKYMYSIRHVFHSITSNWTNYEHFFNISNNSSFGWTSTSLCVISLKHDTDQVYFPLCSPISKKCCLFCILSQNHKNNHGWIAKGSYMRIHERASRSED